MLIMMNSRRLSPAGVGGAPTSPDLSIIPNIMIDRIELLLDGASSVYGSDAVAGVANAIMRKDFEGFEFEVDVSEPTEPGGGSQSLGAMWGGGGDNWDIGVGVEYFNAESVQPKNRDYMSQCDRWLYEGNNGQKLSTYRGLAPGTTESPCKLSTINRVFLADGVFGNIWFTPGRSNIGIPNFSETTVGLRLVGFRPDALIPFDANGNGELDTALVDPDGDGVTDIDLQTDQYNFNGSPRDRNEDFFGGSERINFYAYGDYDLENESNTKLYFETLLARRTSDFFTPGAQFFPDVAGTNPYNPCNQQAPGGVNCVGFFGAFNLGNPEATPILDVIGDRDEVYVRLEQQRYVLGVTGDLPLLQSKAFGNWGFEAYVSYSTSTGKSNSQGINEPELNRSLEYSVVDESGEITCESPDGRSCVPVNVFAPSLYQPGGGSFATEAEQDYLFIERSFDTQVEQTVFSGILQGDLFTLPWNDTTVSLVLGAEHREDTIDSRPNIAAREGLIFGFFRDEGAKGSRTVTEFFFETEFQLLQDLRFAQEWSLNLAARWTDESTYGDNTSYSVKTVYTPVPSITFRGTYGTSFRAPNAQEQFLRGTTGFRTLTDPCVVPADARESGALTGDPATYDASMDDREEILLEGCRATGIDPTVVGLQGEAGSGSYSVEINQRGGEVVRSTLSPETSTSKTYGVVLDLPFYDDFTLRGSITYYDIDITNTIAQLSGAFLLDSCYRDTRRYCQFISRDEEGILDEIVSTPFNISGIISRGVDYNLYAERDFIVGGRNINVQLDVQGTRLLERSFIFQGDVDDDVGTTIYPEWEGSVRLGVGYRDFRLNWSSSYLGGERSPRNFVVDAVPCDGLPVPCRPVTDSDDYWVHTISFAWAPKDWLLTLGVANVFDKAPPLVDSNADGNVYNNVALGRGYDLLGRRLFAGVRKRF